MPIPKSWAQLRAVTRQHSNGLVAKTGRAAFSVTKWLCVFHLFAENVGGPRIVRVACTPLAPCPLMTPYLYLREHKVQGPSMLPTMGISGEVVIEDTLSRRLSPPRINRGDLVSLLSPLEPTKTVCKRVIGLPGDTICVHPDTARMYGKPAISGQKEYVRESGVSEEKELHHVLVPEGHIWISGDNISNSRDSSAFGPVPMALVRGRILARIYPSPRWFNNPIVYID